MFEGSRLWVGDGLLLGFMQFFIVSHLIWVCSEWVVSTDFAKKSLVVLADWSNGGLDVFLLGVEQPGLLMETGILMET